MCFCVIKSLSVIGSWSFVVWAFHLLINLNVEWILEFNLARAMFKLNGDTGPPTGSCLSSSFSSSLMAFSATGFLVGFYTRPTSILMRKSSKVLSSRIALNPGAGSTLITSLGPSRRCSSMHNWRSVSRRVRYDMGHCVGRNRLPEE